MKDLIKELQSKNVDFTISQDILTLDNVYSVPSRCFWSGGDRVIGNGSDDYYYIKDDNTIFINDNLNSSMIINELTMTYMNKHEENILKTLYKKEFLNNNLRDVYIGKGKISIGTKQAFRNLEMEKLLYEGVHPQANITQHISYKRTWIRLEYLKNSSEYKGPGYTYFVTQDGQLLRYSQANQYTDWKKRNLIPIEVSCLAGIRVDNPIESW